MTVASSHPSPGVRKPSATAVSHLQCVTRLRDFEVTLVPARGADGHQITHRSGDDDGADGEHDPAAPKAPVRSVSSS